MKTANVSIQLQLCSTTANTASVQITWGGNVVASGTVTAPYSTSADPSATHTFTTLNFSVPVKVTNFAYSGNTLGIVNTPGSQSPVRTGAVSVDGATMAQWTTANVSTGTVLTNTANVWVSIENIVPDTTVTVNLDPLLPNAYLF
jgi:hypothetical protein